MMNKFFAFLFAVTLSAQSVAAINNPFNKSSRVDIGPDIQWDIKKGVAKKTSTTSDKDGTFYQLRLTQNLLSLYLLDSAAGGVKQFDHLAIDDMQLNGKTSSLFQWCLNNQQGHNRFLEQGLSVKKDICQNKGSKGLFVMKLNQTTYNLLKTSQNLTFVIKPYRSAVVVSFDIPNMTKVFAGIAGANTHTNKKVVASKNAVKNKSDNKSVSKYLSKPIGAVAVTKPTTVKLCSIKPPVNFASIKAVKYFCNNGVAKANARKKMANNVKKMRAEKNKLAQQRKQKSKQSEAEKRARDAKKKKEAEAAFLIDKNTNKIRDEVSEKMIGMCKKKWAEGESRCYCEQYLEFAPASIKPNPSCKGG